MANLCERGCGATTTIYKGKARRFVVGHSMRGRKRPERHTVGRYEMEDRGYTTPCWIWQQFIDRDGYGMKKDHGRDRRAHQVFYERVKGPIPDGLQIDHLCRVRSCVNPDHLEAVTQRENVRRGKNCRLSEDDVEAIIAALGPHREIASRFGISKSYVSHLKTDRMRAAA